MLKNIYIGFDRDGTLEMPGHPIPEKLMAQFIALEQMGAKLFLASGKDYMLLREIAANIKLKTWMICAENGGHIVVPSKEIDYVQPSAPHLSAFREKVYQIALPEYREEPKLSIWSKKFGSQVLDAEKIIKNFIDSEGWDLTVYSYPDGDGGLDVVPPGIDKINLLQHLPNDAEIYYFGDGENDFNLLSNKRVIPCVVANAKAHIQKITYDRGGYLAKQPAGQGVSEIITQLFSV